MRERDDFYDCHLGVAILVFCPTLLKGGVTNIRACIS